jgi:parvulin-like peptidyl-prolyl isomerase
MSDRIVPLETRRVGIVDSAEYKRRLAAQEEGAIVSQVVTQAIAPQRTVPENDVRAYYDAHKKEFAYPVFYRLDGLAYENVKDAQAALDKLRAGTDLKWLKANTAGQLQADKAKYGFGGNLIAVTAMPDELRKQLTAAKVGDVRLFSEGGQSYVVRVSDVTPESMKPFDEVKAEIEEKLFYDKVNAAVADYAGKLRKVKPVKVFITKID